MTMTEIFGDVIHAYTRKKAIADGALVDVTETAREAGFVWPVAMTREAWEYAVAWTEADEKRKPEFTGQDEAGRLWDVVYMAFAFIRGKKARGAAPSVRDNYRLFRIPREGRGLRARPIVLSIVTGPGDNGEPVVTLMMPHED